MYCPKPLLLLFAILAIVSKSFSQKTVDSLLKEHSLLYPDERAHLHTDKPMYLPGETIWFKVYLSSNGLPSMLSTNVYADVVDAGGATVKRITMPATYGVADASFDIPDGYTSSYLTLRAYTSGMLTTAENHVCYQPVQIYQGTAMEVRTKDTSAAIRFFPEGGHAVNGVTNYIVCKAAEDAMEEGSIITIKDNAGNTEDTFSLRNGGGVFKLMPESGKQYVAEWKGKNGEIKNVPLPSASNEFLSLHTDEMNGFLYYVVQSAEASVALKDVTILAYINQQETYKALIHLDGTNVNSGRIPISQLPAGILHIVVLNSVDKALAQTNVLINKQKLTFPVQLEVIEKSVNIRAKNTLEITVPDTSMAYFSLAVYDNDFTKEQLQNDIFSDFLFEDKTTHQPVDISDAKRMKLAVASQAYPSLDWEAIAAERKPSTASGDSSYLCLIGSLNDDKAKDVTLILSQPGAERQWYFIKADGNGRFSQSDLVFYDTATVYYKSNRPLDKGKLIEMSSNNGLLPNTPLLPAAPSFSFSTPNDTKKKNMKVEAYKRAMVADTVHTLTGVVVTTRQAALKKIAELDQRYPTGYFKGLNGFQLDLLTDSLAFKKSDVFDYVVSHIPGLQLGRKLVSKYLKPVSSLEGTIIYYINENEVDADAIQALDLRRIAYIKYMQLPLRGFPKALCVYLKKGEDEQRDLRALPGDLKKITVMGYSRVKDFVSPDYTTPAAAGKQDLRTTLYWQPYLTTDKDNQKVKVSFYNNDVCHSYRIVLEGWNAEGRLIHIEKVVE